MQSTTSGGDNKPDDGLKDIFNALLTAGKNFQDSTAVLGSEIISDRSITLLDIGDANPTRVESNIVTNVRLIPTGNNTLASSTTTTEINYFYGSRSESNLILITNFKSNIDGKPQNQTSKTEFVPMSAARLDFGLISPDP